MSDASPQLPDLSGQSQPIGWIAVDEAAALFSEARMPRNPRTIRRYCMRGDLDCQKTENALHQPQYFISKASVETYIAQQRTLLTARPDLSGQSRTELGEAGHTDGLDSDATEQNSEVDMTGPVQAGPDESGQKRTRTAIAADLHASDPFTVVEQLEARITDKDAEITFLRGELLHRRTTDTALHDVIAAFRANAEAQRLMAAPPAQAMRQSSSDWPSGAPSTDETRNVAEQGTSDRDEFAG